MVRWFRQISLSSAVSLAAFLALLTSSGPTFAAEPVRGGTLNIAFRFTVASLDPLFGNAPGVDRKIFNLFAENLLFQDQSGNFHPVLAKSWKLSDDGKTLHFYLRPEIKFQDGTPFDAEAVKFNLDRLLDPKVKAPASQYVADLESVEVVDPLTVRLNLKRKSGVILAMLAVEPGSMVSPTAVKEKGADFSRAPVGTGPFQIVSWSGNQMSAKRNLHYWRKGQDGKALPYLDQIEIKIIPNSAIRIVELQSGNTHLIDYLETKDFEQVVKNPKLLLLEGATAVTQLLAFNVKQAPFDNADLRRAVSYAINRVAIEKVISKGNGSIMAGIEPNTTWVFDEAVKGHQFDLVKAREYYAKSGHKGPLVLSAIQRDPDTQIAQLLQSMLKAAGIELTLEMMDRQAWLSKVLSYQYGLGLLQASIARPDPDVTYSDLFSAKAARNYAGYDATTTTDPLVSQARAEVDPNVRRKLYSQIQQHVIDNFYISPLFWRPIRDGASKRVQGIEREASMSWFYGDLWLSAGAEK